MEKIDLYADQRLAAWLRQLEAETARGLKEAGLEPHRLYDKQELQRMGISRRMLGAVNVLPLRPGIYYGQHLIDALASYRPINLKRETIKPEMRKKGNLKNAKGKTGEGETARTLRTSLHSLIQD